MVGGDPEAKTALHVICPRAAMGTGHVVHHRKRLAPLDCQWREAQPLYAAHAARSLQSPRSSRPFDSRGATDVPSNPDEIYTKNWISWEDFLNGEYRDEEEQ